MQNRPDNPSRWGSDGARPAVGSGIRIAVIFAGWLVLIALIAVRSAWLQSVGRERFTELWDRETERLESVPARNGRILTADGQILAFDQPRYSLTVHYRWLEDPPDPNWLKSQALSRLAPNQRRNQARLDAAQSEVLAERKSMHDRLAAVSGVTEKELTRRFEEVQQRVEKIVATVEAKRSLVDRGSELPEASNQGETPSLWERLYAELTTPPNRTRRRDPVVVSEELEYHEIVADAPLEVMGQIHSFPSLFPGVDVRLTSGRRYPQEALAAHLIGVRTRLHEDERHARRDQLGADPLGYRPGESMGRSGVELACDRILHGVSGLRRRVTNRQGEILSQELVRPPINGRDVVLTIDGRLQRQAEALLDAVVIDRQHPRTTQSARSPESVTVEQPQPVGGCLVAIDVRTGEIITAAASPRFDIRLLVSATSAEWDAVANDPRQPFFPRVTQAMLPPGSVFKTLTAIAGIESGVIDPNERFECRGYLNRPDRERCAIFRHFGVGHGPINLQDALAQSCNVYFFDLARRLGPQPLATWAQRFGCGVSSGFDVPGERFGHLPRPDQPGRPGERWYPGMTRQLAIGQGELTMTPLQVVRMMAAVANDGWLVPAHVVRRSPGRSSHGRPEPTASGVELIGLEADELTEGLPRPVRIPGLSAGTLEQVRRGLVDAVEHPRGTGREARLKGIRIAGKTGTAEIGGGRPDHAWFAGYAPAETPRIAFVVVIEQGGSGGQMAAPLAREFVRAWNKAATSFGSLSTK